MVDPGAAAAPRGATARGRAACRIGAVALLACAFTGRAEARPTLDAERLAELARYQVLTYADAFRAGLDRGKAIGVIDATPEEVFRIATDFQHYKEFMPRVSAAEQVTRNGDWAQVTLTGELPWPAGRTWIEAEYRFEHLAGDIHRIRFDMKRGNMRQYLGSLYIEPWSKTQSAVTYEIVAEPDVSAPKSFVNKGVRRSAGSFVHALRQRINELHRLGLLHPIAPATPTPPATIVAPDPATLKAHR
jgi:ribosome-associated toxin RatA of RatAB toxin-antitoxin module